MTLSLVDPRSERVELDYSARTALVAADLAALTEQRRARAGLGPEAQAAMAARHAEALRRVAGGWGDVDTTNLFGRYYLGVDGLPLDRVAEALKVATKTAVLWPHGGAGFDHAAFLLRLEGLCRDPACTLGEGGIGELRDLVASNLEACAWVLATEDRIGSGTLYWYGHCSEWFVQPLGGACLRILHIAGESC